MQEAGRREAAETAEGSAAAPRSALRARYLGYQVVGGERRPLPPGSTFDPETGIFSWQLGPGFLGRYELAFVHRSGRPGPDKAAVRVVVTID